MYIIYLLPAVLALEGFLLGLYSNVPAGQDFQAPPGCPMAAPGSFVRSHGNWSPPWPTDVF